MREVSAPRDGGHGKESAEERGWRNRIGEWLRLIRPLTLAQLNLFHFPLRRAALL